MTVTRPRLGPTFWVALATVTVAASGTVPAAAQQLDVSAIFGGTSLQPEELPELRWAPDGARMTFVVPGERGATDLVAVSLVSGEAERLVDGRTLIPPGEGEPVPIEGYDWSPDGRALLIYTRSQRVWRDNTKGVYFVYSLDEGTLHPLSTAFGWQMFAKFSPDGRRVGFVRNNDLFVVDLAAGTETRLTHDGSDAIVNGTFDWVHEEELGLQDGWRWSPDGRHIAFWRLDQTPIKAFYLIDDLGLYSRPIPIPYPKAGEPNSLSAIGVVDVASGQTRWMDTGDNPDTYLARMDWGRTPGTLVIQRMNRRQNRIDVLETETGTGRSRVLFTETSETWVDVDEDLSWVDDERFLWTSDRDGFQHIYLYGRDGGLVRQVTRGPFDVDEIVGVDPGAGQVYFTAGVETPLVRHLYRVDLLGSEPERITSGDGTHEIEMSPGAAYFVDGHSRAGVPPVVTAHRSDGTELGTLVDNRRLRERLAPLKPPEFFRFTTSDGVDLNGWRIIPPDFDESERHPVLMYVYGGPGSQTVRDNWGGDRYLWHQLLAQNGIVVISIDGRGTGARGRDFKKLTYLDLGRWETRDQLEGAAYLASQPWVDAERIGIWGWSYGGYMTLMSMMKGGDRFRAGISVAPVTSWRLYDNIYTERFMRTPRENSSGYEGSAPLAHVEELTGDLLLIHGTGDDNVHFQNSVQLASALQEAGKQFDFMAYPNKTHSIDGPRTRVHLFTLMTDWIVEHLAADGRDPKT